MHQPYPENADLFEFLNKPKFVPVRYRHLKRGTTYLVVSDDEFHLNTFSEEGSLHEFPYEGRKVICTMQFSGDGNPDNRYAGPIVIYMGEEDGRFWLRPKFEFHDGRFERITT